jgi:LysM repeat protein
MRRLYLISPLLLAIFIILIVTATEEKPADLSSKEMNQEVAEDIVVETPTASPTSTPTASPKPTSTPSPTPLPEFIYTVQATDTLWTIAVQFDLSIDEIMLANPQLNPAGLLFPGDQLIIPGVQRPARILTEEDWQINAKVVPEGGGLRLRDGPGLEHDVIQELAALTPLTILVRTADSTWLEVRTASGDFGWVSAEWVEASIDLEDIPILTESTGVERPTTAPTPIVTSSPESPGEPAHYPFISGVNDHVRQIFVQGQALGNRANVFSKVGDSITTTDAFLYPIGRGEYSLHGYTYLQPMIDFYSEEWARTNNSFANLSLAAGIGWSAHALLSSDISHETLCGEREWPLECEYRLVKPSVALIMLGTNDVPSTPLSSYEQTMREILDTTIEYGIVPILSTIPPIQMPGTEDRVESINNIIRNLAHEYDIPLLDYWAAMQGLPNEGLRSDGVHPSHAPAGENADFTPENLQYGMPVRSLTALQALDLVWRTVLPEG